MVLHSAQYKRQNNEDAAFEDIMDTNVHTNSTTANSYIPQTNQGARSGSIINSNSISLGNNLNSVNSNRSSIHQHHQPSTAEADLSARIESNNDDNLSFGSDRLCTAPEGHVRFVNSTIRYHMAGPGFWQARSSLERGLLIISALLTTLCSILLLVIAGTTQHHSNTLTTICDDPHVTIHRLNNISSQPQYCTSKECVKVAASILSDLDESVDPCDDFYHFSCGGWIKKNPIPDGQSDWSMFKKLTEANELVIKNALESGKFKPNSAKEKAQRYYNSCIDKKGNVEKLGGKPLLDLMRQKVGAWQLLSKSGETFEPISNLTIFRNQLFTFHNELQASGFFSWTVGENDKNSSQHVIQIDQGGLTLPTRDYYLNENDTTVVDALKKVIFKVVILLITDKNSNEDGGGSKNSASFDSSQQIDEEMKDRIKKQIQQLVDFETEIAKITKSQAERRQDSKTYRNTSLSKLNEKADFLDWKAYFNRAFMEHLNRSLEEEYQDVTYAEEYIVSVSKLVQSKIKTPEGRQTLDNYMNWQLVKGMRGALSKKYQDAGKILEKALIGTEIHDERWRECVRDTDKTLGFAVGAMFIKNAFDGDSKDIAEEMVVKVKEAFQARLNELKWIDSETREAAIKKAVAITDMIGYPAYIMEEDENSLNNKYYNLTVDDDQYYNNTVKRNRFALTEDMRKLFKTVNRTKWSMTPDAVNAYYTPSKNQIVFPAGILQSPFFNLKYPKSINYGAMGVVMGHELSHAFDDQGREFDENGNMRVWWTNQTSEAFKNLTQCMANQYSQYTMEVKDGKELNVRGKQTLGENIADNGGLTAAFRAYNKWISDHKTMMMTNQESEFDQTSLPLPGLHQYSQNQLFFLSFSQVWCSSATPEANKLQILEDPHSPARFRVIGALSNSEEFQRAWQCKKGTQMNPSHKCTVW